jgi:DNA-binding transcriptional ArsR family regulator
MTKQKEETKDTSKDKLDLILLNVMKLSERIDNLDNRISNIEESLEQQSKSEFELTNSEESTTQTYSEQDFENLDEHLKRTYKILASAKKPMTASEVAERMGRSRSTTSYHLNKLTNLDFLEKFSGKSKDNSRNMFFRPK